MRTTNAAAFATAGALALLCACGSGSNGAAPPIVDTLAVHVAANVVSGTLAPLWRDHYDLSYVHADYAQEPGFTALVDELAPRSWRCSIGRWEIGFPPPAGGDSTNLAVLGAVEREFYRGPATLVGAADPANYDFDYLDTQLAALIARGAQPFLCFDYMPLTLSSQQDPANADNFNLTQPGQPYSLFSFSNGIRTAPPANVGVYARVVRNTIRHVRGLFAGTTDFGVEYFEIGNEPDLVDANGAPVPFFWTGDRQQFADMYAAIAADVDADATISSLVRIGAGSFAFLPSEPDPAFLVEFAAQATLLGTRFDFLSFHTYSDEPLEHLERLVTVRTVVDTLQSNAELVDAEWGRALDGVDPVYDTIEHGLFRAEVIAYMQVLGVRVAHEALLRDPGPEPNLLGLLRTGPPAHKPVAHCYQALGLLDAAPQALQVSAPAGLFVFAGRDAAGTRVVVVAVVDDPGAGHATRIDLTLSDLPFGGAGFEVRRSRVTEASSASGAGLELVDTNTLVGSEFLGTLEIGAGQAGLYVWELVAL